MGGSSIIFSRLVLVGLLSLLFAPTAFATLSYLSVLPNANNVPCPTNAQNCTSGNCPAFGHMDPSLTVQECSMPVNGATDLNSFGIHWRDNAHNWTAVCMLDSDGDGKYNGDELGDPCCVWVNGTARFPVAISHPGDATDVTSRSSCHDSLNTPFISATYLDITGTSVKLTWSYPDNIDCYCGFRVDIVGVTDSVYFPSSPLATTQTVTGFQPNTDYRVYVRAFNWYGASPITASSTVEFTTQPATVADPPTNLTAITSKKAMNVSWVAPTDDGNSPISGYEIEFDDLYTYETEGTETTYQFTDLRAGEDYRVRVRTVNGVGTGNWTLKYKFTTQSPASTITSSILVVLLAVFCVILL